MPTTLEISYFNSFWLKEVKTSAASANGDGPTGIPFPIFPNGYPYQNTVASKISNLDPFPGNAQNTGTRNFYIEEARIRGGYNNTSTDYGVKAYLVEEEPNQQHRLNTLIYSGIFNSRTGVNNTNQFPVGASITTSVDPINGSIQKLHAEDTNLIIFQEEKVSRSLIDKDAIYTAEGNAAITTSPAVIGQNIPFKGNFGISTDPLSFAVYGYRKYFTDRDRNSVLRLSQDGLTEISNLGMYDFFRDELTNLSTSSSFSISGTSNTGGPNLYSFIFNNSNNDIPFITKGMEIILAGVSTGAYVVDVTLAQASKCFITHNLPLTITQGGSVELRSPVKGGIVGGYDIHNKNYTLSIQQAPDWATTSSSGAPIYKTLSFDELPKGWTTFYSYCPTFTFSLKNNYYTTKNGQLYKHYNPGLNNRNLFYDAQYDSNITFVFNPATSTSKVFQTINYEGSNGWCVNSYSSGFTGVDSVTVNGATSEVSYQDTINKIYSYQEGSYDDYGAVYPAALVGNINRAGFDRKENKYMSNLINNSQAQAGEIIFGNSMSGIKGYFATIKMSTDTVTNVGGAKELFAVSSNYIESSY